MEIKGLQIRDDFLDSLRINFTASVFRIGDRDSSFFTDGIHIADDILVCLAGLRLPLFSKFDVTGHPDLKYSRKNLKAVDFFRQDVR